MPFDKNAYNQQYHKDHMKQIKFTLNRNTDQDLIAHLQQQPNIAAYLKRLIYEDMTKEAGE